MRHYAARFALGLQLLLSASALTSRALAQPTVAEASPEEQQIARSAYAEGVRAFEREDYATALGRFEATDRAVSSPNVKLMRARCLAALGRGAEAFSMYDATRQQAASWDDGRYQTSADAAAQEQRELEGKLGLSAQKTAASEGTTAPVDEERSPSIEPTPSAPPKAAARELSAPSRPAPSRGSPAADGGVPMLPLALGVAGGVGLASFATFGVMSQSEWSKLERECSDDKRCRAGLSRTAERGRTYQTVANVSLGVAAALLASCASLFVLHVGDDVAEIAITPGGVRVRGRM